MRNCNTGGTVTDGDGRHCLSGAASDGGDGGLSVVGVYRHFRQQQPHSERVPYQWNSSQCQSPTRQNKDVIRRLSRV